MAMRIKQFALSNDFLKKYVEYYYLLSTVGDTENTTYLAFPSCRTPLGFFKNTSSSKSPNEVSMSFSPNNSLVSILAGNFIKPLQVIFEPNILEFCVKFKPLGLNFFVKNNLGKTLSEK